MPRAVVTGGAGFLGSHVCERLLAEGWHVLCLDTLLTGREENLAACVRTPGSRSNGPMSRGSSPWRAPSTRSCTSRRRRRRAIISTTRSTRSRWGRSGR